MNERLYPTAGKSGCRTPEQRMANNLQRRSWSYGDYVAAHERQNGLCAICGLPPRGKGKTNSRLHADHCHKTGRPRKLLCRRCNTILGLATEDCSVLEGAIEYLKEFECQS